MELPALLVARPEVGADSAAAVFAAPGLRVIVDQGPFSDALDSYVGRPDYRDEDADFAGIPGRVVFFRSPARGTYTVGARIPQPMSLTVVVQAEESVPGHVPRDIVRSIQPRG